MTPDDAWEAFQSKWSSAYPEDAKHLFVTAYTAGEARVLSELREFLPEWDYPPHVVAAICLEIKDRALPEEGRQA